MSLVVEDGSIVQGAESYVTVAEFKDYCDLRGLSYSTLSTDTKIEQAARKAYDYLLQVYQDTWRGYRKSPEQTGDWPRVFVYLNSFTVDGNPVIVDDTTIPVAIKHAQFELMLRSQTTDLLPDTSSRLESSITVGPIKVDYADSSANSKPKYNAIDALVNAYLVSSTINVGITSTAVRS